RRRAALLARAAELGALVIEDDYDCELAARNSGSACVRDCLALAAYGRQLENGHTFYLPGG
ncbi:MAG: hypothetical protein ACLGJA_24970, partial [Gammaproteobacteria bacterium]